MGTLLKTGRLILTPWETKDQQEFYEININPYVRKYLWDDIIIAEETVKEILENNAKYFEEHAWGIWKVIKKDDHETIGYAGLWYFFDQHQPELLYAIRPQYAGLGYATEAARLVIDYAFSHLGYRYLSASTDTPHERSRKMCERLNMRHIEDSEIEGKFTSFYRLENPNNS